MTDLLHKMFPWITGKIYSPSQLMSEFSGIIETYILHIAELDNEYLENSVNNGVFTLPEDEKEAEFEQEEIPDQPTTIDNLLSEYFQVEVDEYISSLKKIFKDLEKSPGDKNHLKKLIEKFQSFKEISMIHGYVKLEDFCSDMISLLNQAKKENNVFNPDVKNKVDNLLNTLQQTDKFKDAKIDTDESIQVNSFLDEFYSTLFVASSEDFIKKEEKAKPIPDKTVDVDKESAEINCNDQSSLIEVLKSLLKDIEPVIKKILSTDKPVPVRLDSLLIRLLNAAEIINHAGITICLRGYQECTSLLNRIDNSNVKAAGKELSKVYSDITKQISLEFKPEKIQKRLHKFRDKYSKAIDDIAINDIDELLSILMETEKSKTDQFLKNIKLAIVEDNADSKDLITSQLSQLSSNLAMIGTNQFSEFPSFYLSLLEGKSESVFGKEQVDILANAYQAIAEKISEQGIKAKIENDLLLLKKNLTSKEAEIESLAEEQQELDSLETGDHAEEKKISETMEEEDLDEIFKQESESYLNTINDALKKLDANLDDRSAYESIERSLHSLKSSARLMGYSEIADISSPFEEIFEVLHSSSQKIKSDDLSVIKEVVDGLSSGIKGEVVDPKVFIEKLNSIDVAKPSEPATSKNEELKEEQLFAGSTDEDEDLLEIFKDESAEYITIVEKANETLATNPNDTDALGQLEHAMHSLKTAAKMLGFSDIGQIADSVEMIAVGVQKGELSGSPLINNNIKSAIDLIKTLTSGEKKSSDNVEKIVQGLDTNLLKKADSGSAVDILSETGVQKGYINDEQTEMFIKEGWELLEKINRDLVTLEKDPNDKSVIDNLNRTIHTLKGSAQILNFQYIGKLAHKIEDLFAKSKESKQGLSEKSMDLTFKAVDTIQDLLNGIKRGEGEKSSDVVQIIEKIEEQLGKTGRKKTEVQLDDRPVVPATKPKIIPVEKFKDSQKDVDQVIKITTETLDNLVNMAAELVINKTQLSAYLDKLREVGETLDVDKKRLRKTSRTISSFLEKTIGDDKAVKIKEDIDKNVMDDLVSVSNDFEEVISTYDSVSRSFRAITQEFEQNIGQISTLTKSLHDDILQVRMVPTEMLFNRFPRAVRDMAKKLKKKVNLVVEGEKTEMDRALIESLTDPVMHLVRNAIDHGIETPKERKDKGKSEDGIILLKARRSKNQILIEVQDDGNGIDPEIVKKVILKNKLASNEEVDEMSPSEIMSFVFDPGFSTRDEASDVSGRGVGLDVVANQLQKLKGDIRIKSTPGVGTIFNIRVPLTLAIAQAMLVKVDTETLAIPIAAVEETVQFKDPELVEQDEKAFITVRDQLIPVAYLSALLNYRTGKKSAGSKSNTAIIVQESGARYGLIVDNVLRREEIVIKSLGDHLAHVPYISGGTIYGDGSVGLILDIPSVTKKIEADVHSQDKDFSDIERAREIVTEESQKGTVKKEATKKEQEVKETVLVKKKKIRGRSPKALIVDDSVSVRKFVSSVLEKNKYATALAEDGPEALEKLRKEKFDIIITDLEMPKMHGFDMIEEIRSYKKYQSIPIVILTGRAGKKHKDKGKELGANAYITKPFKENDLLKSLEDFLEIV